MVEEAVTYTTSKFLPDLNAELSFDELRDRYRLSVSSMYDRINGFKQVGVDMTPHRRNRRAIYRLDQIAKLDDMHSRIQAGETIGDVAESYRQVYEPSFVQVAEDYQPASDQLGLVPLEQSFSGVMPYQGPQSIIVQSPRSPFAYLDDLKKAAEQGYYLKTSEIATCLGVSPSTISKKAREQGGSFVDGSFQFSLQGKRISRNGSEFCYRVEFVE